jgi:exo-beta-1,3-glucanase (GH17 family)
MRTSTVLCLAALAAQAVSAVPHRESLPSTETHTHDIVLTDENGRDHMHQHHNVEARAEPALPGTVTVTKTIVQPSEIVWVNKAGQVVSTETKAPPAGSAPTSPPSNTNNPPPPPVAAPGEFNQAAGNNQPAQQNKEDPEPALTPSPNTDTTTTSKIVGGYGICYDMINGASQCKSDSTLDSEFAFLSGQGYKLVRTYDIGCNMGSFVSKAAAHGMKAFIGINNIDNVAGDLGKLITMVNGNWGPVDTINIGNEKVNHGIAPSVVAAAVAAGRGILRAAGYNGAVVTVDVFNSWTPELAAASDYVAANAHGFFDSSNTAEKNGQWLQNTYDGLQKIAGGKQVVITESGWPHAGSNVGSAVAGKAQQETAISGIKSAFANKQGSLFVFQAYDATYKQPGALGIEASFGIYGGS